MKTIKGIVRIAFVLVAVAFLMPSCDKLKEPFIEGADDEKAILQFDVDTVVGVIDEASKTVTLGFPDGTDVTNLVPTIRVSNYATVEPASGVAQDFTEPVVYTVTAFNGTTVQYQVSASANRPKITSFQLEEPNVMGVIDEDAGTVTLYLLEGADITNLTPVIEVSEGASVEPASGVAQDFTQPIDYTVTAPDGSVTVYTVTAYVVELSGKTVLIKDFTGARCVNCPAAAEYAHNLQQQLGEDRVFILSVHAGYLAQPVGQFPNFITEEGTAWYNNNSSNPLFSVDHVALTEGNTLYVEQIDTPLNESLAESQSFEIVVHCNFDPFTRLMNVTAQLIALNDMEGDYRVTVGLVEDNIVGRQIIPGGVDTAYVFHNVFRGALNGANGTAVAEGSIARGQQFPIRYLTQLQEDYNADECYIMVYVHDRNQNDKILQTSMLKIK